MLKRDPDFMYEMYHSDALVIDLAVAVSKALLPLSKIHPNVFQFAKHVLCIP